MKIVYFACRGRQDVGRLQKPAQVILIHWMGQQVKLEEFKSQDHWDHNLLRLLTATLKHQK